MSVDASLLSRLCAFLDGSPTPFHAVANLRTRLEAAGYEPLEEAEAWSLKPEGRYLVTRNDSALIAFRAPGRFLEGPTLIGGHTDSPALKLKPKPELDGQGLLRLAVEPYGGVLQNPWFDRDLALAGRVHFRDESGLVTSARVNLPEKLAIIPSLAIHLDKEANQKRSINAQTDLPALFAFENSEAGLERLLTTALKAAGHAVDRILDHELLFYDTQGAARLGVDGAFLASARLDNLLSCFCATEALLASGDAPALIVLNDHEEVGSASSSGAAGPFLDQVLRRITPEEEASARLRARAWLISADNAHAVHPNFPDRHDRAHGPLLGGGPVIKINANQRYASNSATQAKFRDLCEQVAVPVQSFVTRSDLGCGSTIGPITAAELGIATVDVGIPQLAMHSIRELCAGEDVAAMVTVLTRALG